MTSIAAAPQTEPAATFEYAVVSAPRAKESLYRDTYSNFGWTFEGYDQAATGRANVALRLKRDRRIKNRTLIQELQRTSETALDAIESLERSRTLIPSVVAYVIGIIGCVFLGGSVFALQGGAGLLSVILGAIGIAWWIAPLFTYIGMRVARTNKVAPRIAAQYQTIYDNTDRALRLAA